MVRQWQKLVVILNICFWLMLALRFTNGTRVFPSEILNVIVVLGMSAIAFNAGYAAYRLYIYWKKRPPMPTNPWLDAFILVSFLFQLYFTFFLFP